MTTHAVSVRGLAKTYPGGVEAVRGIDFDVAPGEVFGLLGPDGAGKSTTIGMRYGLTDPSGSGLHDIWGAGNTTAQAWLSLGVVAAVAAAFAAPAVRAFTRAAVR